MLLLGMSVGSIGRSGRTVAEASAPPEGTSHAFSNASIGAYFDSVGEVGGDTGSSNDVTARGIDSDFDENGLDDRDDSRDGTGTQRHQPIGTEAPALGATARLTPRPHVAAGVTAADGLPDTGIGPGTGLGLVANRWLFSLALALGAGLIAYTTSKRHDDELWTRDR